MPDADVTPRSPPAGFLGSPPRTTSRTVSAPRSISSASVSVRPKSSRAALLVADRRQVHVDVRGGSARGRDGQQGGNLEVRARVAVAAAGQRLRVRDDLGARLDGAERGLGRGPRGLADRRRADLALVLGLARELHRGAVRRVRGRVLVRQLEAAVHEPAGDGDRLGVERGVLRVLGPVLRQRGDHRHEARCEAGRDRRGAAPAGDGLCGRQPVHEGGDRQVAEARARFHPPIVGTAPTTRVSRCGPRTGGRPALRRGGVSGVAGPSG